jgi:hypothetical protein
MNTRDRIPAVQNFFDGIKALRHEIHDTWDQPDVVICRGEATYTRHDSSTLTVRFANVFGMEKDLMMNG